MCARYFPVIRIWGPRLVYDLDERPSLLFLQHLSIFVTPRSLEGRASEETASQYQVPLCSFLKRSRPPHGPGGHALRASQFHSGSPLHLPGSSPLPIQHHHCQHGAAPSLELAALAATSYPRGSCSRLTHSPLFLACAGSCKFLLYFHLPTGCFLSNEIAAVNIYGITRSCLL